MLNAAGEADTDPWNTIGHRITGKFSQPPSVPSSLTVMPRLTSTRQIVSALALCLLSTARRVLAANNAPEQPQRAEKVNTFEIVGNSTVSAQQVTSRRPLLRFIWLTLQP
jgi:hypothetical protein